MSTNFSRNTIKEYIPTIRRIFSVIEIDLKKYLELNKRDFLTISFLEKEFGLSKLKYSMEIIGTWLDGSPYSANFLQFTKKNEKINWNNLLKIIDKNIIEYINDAPTIEIKITKNGIVSREILGDVLTSNISEDGMKLKILETLAECTVPLSLHTNLVSLIVSFGGQNCKLVR